jgi:uncharacterized lipoprotein YddW (UPF0748 family)
LALPAPWWSACSAPQPTTSPAPPATPEVRATWLTTTANEAIASPTRSAASMQRLREIGLNTVYVEVWKNGYTQYPSAVLERTLGVAQRPAQALQDPSDTGPAAARDLLQETLIQAHRQGLLYFAWFEYGFMAAHGSSMNHLRRMKPDWLSRDAQGSDVAPNGFVWLNPLHPQARRFLLDLVLEAVQRYDLDGVQFDDRIVWPHVTMGYDDTTRAVYAAEHAGQQPPLNARDPAWMRWRADKLNALVQEFMAELKAARPGLLFSISPAVYPWSYDNYLLNWPAWARWPQASRFDEWVPQAYRLNYAAFEATWLQQVRALQDAGAYRAKQLVAGIRINGVGKESDWPQLRDSMALVRQQGQGGHALWFSRGVLDQHAQALTQWYASSGPAQSPHFPAHWRRPALPLVRDSQQPTRWSAPQGQPANTPETRWRAIAMTAGQWRYLPEDTQANTPVLQLPEDTQAVELVLDRRGARR